MNFMGTVLPSKGFLIDFALPLMANSPDQSTVGIWQGKIEMRNTRYVLGLLW